VRRSAVTPDVAMFRDTASGQIYF